MAAFVRAGGLLLLVVNACFGGGADSHAGSYYRRWNIPLAAPLLTEENILVYVRQIVNTQPRGLLLQIRFSSETGDAEALIRAGTGHILLRDRNGKITKHGFGSEDPFAFTIDGAAVEIDMVRFRSTEEVREGANEDVDVFANTQTASRSLEAKILSRVRELFPNAKLILNEKR
jgi:hypothetical protein